MLKENLLVDDIKIILRKNGFKITPTRISVLEIFFKNHKPVSALYINKKLNGSINEATTYRMLSSFEKAGIINKIDLKVKTSDTIFVY